MQSWPIWACEDPEERVQVQAVYLGGDPRGTGRGAVVPTGIKLGVSVAHVTQCHPTGEITGWGLLLQDVNSLALQGTWGEKVLATRENPQGVKSQLCVTVINVGVSLGRKLQISLKYSDMYSEWCVFHHYFLWSSLVFQRLQLCFLYLLPSSSHSWVLRLLRTSRRNLLEKEESSEASLGVV